MSRGRGWGAAALAVVVALVLALPIGAQRVGRAFYDDVHNGYRFRGPEDWTNIPPQPDQLEAGIVCRMEGAEKVFTVSGKTYAAKPALAVIVLREPAAPAPGPAGRELPDDEPDEDDEEDEDEDEDKPLTLEDILELAFGRIRHMEAIDRETIGAHGDLEGQRVVWKGSTDRIALIVDTFTFPLDDAEVCMAFLVPEEHYKKWNRTFEGCAKSFERTGRAVAIEWERDGTYADILAYHTQIVSRTPGWRVLPTPSQKYVITTSATDTRFVEEVIERLELSRALFEKDYPLGSDHTHVSVVRICGTEEEFHSYGGTPQGVGGWFSSETTELVLFDYKSIDRNATYSVMSHEAFHQYCHFLFDESEAHRWFDEGHGDYYGGVRFERGRAEITKKMPAGFDRLGPIKSMVQMGQYAPLKQHLHFSHSEWQRQGPSNVSGYAQSWSIVYMLRQGMLGNVSDKIWRPEYAEILPNYMESLHAGHRQAYAEILAERELEAKEEGRELTAEERDIGRFDLEDERKELIWNEAMDASWGKIDLAAFEENWLTFVRKHL